jgi:hypothetical protein
MREAIEIHLTEEERNQLESWVRKGTMEQRFVERARIALEAATGKTTKEIAQTSAQGYRCLHKSLLPGSSSV